MAGNNGAACHGSLHCEFRSLRVTTIHHPSLLHFATTGFLENAMPLRIDHRNTVIAAVLLMETLEKSPLLVLHWVQKASGRRIIGTCFQFTVEWVTGSGL